MNTESFLDAATIFCAELDGRTTEAEYLATEHIQIAMLLFPGERAGDVLRRLTLEGLLEELATRTVEASARAESLTRLTARRNEAQKAKQAAEHAKIAQLMAGTTKKVF